MPHIRRSVKMNEDLVIFDGIKRRVVFYKRADGEKN